MDGVLAEYRKDCTENDMKKKGYFLSLKPEINMVNALTRLALDSDMLGIKVCVLTKVYPTQFKYSVREKLEWRDEYLPELFDSEFIMVNGEEQEKSEAVRELTNGAVNSDCYLIDDYNPNLAEWVKNGGNAVKYVNEINDKNRSFVGNRITHTMTEDEIYSFIVNLVNGTTTPTNAAA